ncbi:MAG: hypothetical protein BGO39_24385 [Chloroflexi bacterium 54-19]|nr:MAG: hypothetical protein BGO39_24385 [Chloroflexi bacterium 54-19]
MPRPQPRPVQPYAYQSYNSVQVPFKSIQPAYPKKEKRIPGGLWAIIIVGGIILFALVAAASKNNSQTGTSRANPTSAGVIASSNNSSNQAVANPSQAVNPTKTSANTKAVVNPTSTSAPVQAPSQSEPSKANLQYAIVTNVVDGDTIDVATLSSGNMRIRLIGMDTPETKDPNRPVMCFGQEATNKTVELLNQSNNEVYLEKDVSETDRYGRFLRYVWITEPDGKLYMLNEELVRWGFAQAATYPPDVKYQSRFVSLTSEARNANRGLWSVCGSFGVPLVAPTVAPPPPAAQQPERVVTDESYPCLDGQIKGNNNSGIYHMPWQQYYAATYSNVQCFDSEQEAINAGFRKAKV